MTMSTATWDVVVVGSANTDYTIRGRELPKPGETARGEQFLIGQGGKGANQAVAAARLQARVSFIGRIGRDDRGEMMLNQLQTEGVDTQYLVRDDQAATGAAVIQVAHSGEKQIFTAANANANLSIKDIRRAEAIRQTRILVAQLEVPLETVLEAARLSHQAGAKIILDPAPPREIPDELLRLLYVIKPNSSEAEKLTGIKVKERASARQAADKLLARGVTAVAIQAGDEGNLLVWGDGETWLPKIPVKSVDATGAGDAFTAGLAVALGEGQSWQEAGRFANAAAALKTTKMGAQDGLPDRQAVLDLIEQQA
jgi:ribokinase